MTLLPYVGFILVLALIAGFLKGAVRASLLLAASFAFYASFDLRFPLLLAAIIAVTYLGGLWVEKSTRSQRLAVSLSGLAVLIPLIFYKYILVWLDSWVATYPTSSLDFGGYGAVLIPVGLSFFTFQCLGYLIDIHRRAYRADRNILRLGLFISFFPQLLAGPIERYAHLAEPLWRTQRTTPSMAMEGLLWIAYGLFLKLAVADRLAPAVDQAYAEITGSSHDAAVAFLGFYLQLFADFGGYSLIAVGAGLLFGVRLTDNFKQPFFATNIVEFWQRWHISLTRWVGDYVYRPVGRYLVKSSNFSRQGQEAITAFVTWVVIGLWHGATLNFLVFGLLQAVTILGYKRIARQKGEPNLGRYLAGWVFTTLFIVISFGLIRAPDLNSFWMLLQSLGSWSPGSVTMEQAWMAYGCIVIMIGVEAARRFLGRSQGLLAIPARGVLVCIAVLAVVSFGFEAGRSFVYFRF